MNAKNCVADCEKQLLYIVRLVVSVRLCWFCCAGFVVLVWLCRFGCAGLVVLIWLCWFGCVGFAVLVWLCWVCWFGCAAIRTAGLSCYHSQSINARLFSFLKVKSFYFLFTLFVFAFSCAGLRLVNVVCCVLLVFHYHFRLCNFLCGLLVCRDLVLS